MRGRCRDASRISLRSSGYGPEPHATEVSHGQGRVAFYHTPVLGCRVGGGHGRSAGDGRSPHKRSDMRGSRSPDVASLIRATKPTPTRSIEPSHGTLTPTRPMTRSKKAEPGDEETLEPLIEAEWAAAAALAATVPATLAGAAAALDHVRLLRERDNYLMLDDLALLRIHRLRSRLRCARLSLPRLRGGWRAIASRVGARAVEGPHPSPRSPRSRGATLPEGEGIRQANISLRF